MKVRFTDREFIRRFGASPIEVSDAQAARYMESKQAIPVTSFDNPPLDTKPREKKVADRPASAGGRRPLVGWLHDTEKHGGAELSNFTVIKAGEDFGFGIYLCSPHTFDKNRLVECDFLIVSNFFFFESEQYHFILDLIFEYKKPFIKYEHDHREIMGEQSRLALASLLFGHSFLNVFISPMQAENHRKSLGDLIDPFFLLPPAVDTTRFRELDGIERDKHKMVSVTGRLRESKGFRLLLQFVMAKQKWYRFEIYTRKPEEVLTMFGRFKCVKVFPPVDNDYLPKVYNSAGFTIHLPKALEACGRTIAEGLLCGCRPITNNHVGIKSFEEFHIGDKKLFNLETFRAKLARGPYDFWRAVDLAWHGLYERSSLWRGSREGMLPFMRKEA